MTARHLFDSARIDRPARRGRGLWGALLGASLAAIAGTTSAGAQKALPVGAELTAALRARTHESEPDRVRGEAALALATVGDPADANRFRAMIEERAPETLRARAALALAILAQPGAEATLGRLLTDSDPRDPMRAVGSFGLGLLPSDQVTPALDHWSQRLRGANRRTEAAPLAALAAATTLRERADRQTLLVAALRDPSWKEPTLRAALTESLHTLGFPFSTQDLEALLEDDESPVRRAALAAVGAHHAELRDPIYRLLRTSRDPEERAAALDALTELRSYHAVTAVEVLADTGEPWQLEAAVRCGLRLGGARLRGSLAEHVATTRNREARMRAYRVWRGGVPSALRDVAQDDLDDVRLGLTMRVAAATLLAGDADIETETHSKLLGLLQLALRDSRDADTLTTALAGLRTLHATPDDLATRWDLRADALDLVPARLEAALRCDRPEVAQDLLAKLLDSDHAEPVDVERALRAFWQARQPTLRPFAGEALGQRLRRIWNGPEATAR